MRRAISIWAFIVLLYAAIAALAVLLAGCAVASPQHPDDNAWYRDPAHYPLPAVWVLGDAAAGRLCNGGTACAVRDYDDGVCYVVSYMHNLAPRLRAHEQHHCDGYSHPLYWDFSHVGAR
jgi:hypothetical protein